MFNSNLIESNKVKCIQTMCNIHHNILPPIKRNFLRCIAKSGNTISVGNKNDLNYATN